MAKYLGIPLQVASGTTVTPTYGSPELVDNGDFITTLAPNTVSGAAGTSNITWNAQGGGSAKLIYNTVDNTSLYLDLVGAAIENGKLYEMSISITDILAGSLVKVFDGLNQQIKQTIGAGVTTFSFTATSTVSSIRIYRQEAGLDSELYINSVSLKEVPFVLGKEQVVNGDFSSSVGWVGSDTAAQVSVSNNKIRVTNGDASAAGFTSTDGSPTISVVAGKTYRISYKSTKINSANESTQLFAAPTFNGGSVITTTFTTDGAHEFFYTASSSESLYVMIKNNSVVLGDVFDYEDLSVKEVQYNYLQVVGGDLLKESKVGDVVFNYSDDTEAVVLQVISNDVLLLSNDILSDAGDSFSIFAPNGDTRGNQLLRVDNYIISEYDEASSLPNKSSFWFAAGPQADKVTLQQLNNAVNTYFVADVIERFVQRLNAQSATASRLDIPLNEFRDHKYNQVLTTTAITLS